MNKVIETIDAALYDTTLWLWLIPRTLCKVVLRPAWTVDYTKAELDKPAEERFNDYMPPVLFLIASGVLPLAVFVDSVAAFWLKQHPNDLLRHIAEQSWEVKLLFAAVSVASAPMSVAISIQLFRRERLGRSELRSVFLPQAYLWGAWCGIAFVVGLGFVMAGFLRQAPMSIPLAIVWISIAEEMTISRYFGSGWKKVVVVMAATVLFLLFEFTMVTVILFGLGGVPGWMLGAPT
jgi:hypothetical protein